MGWVNGITQQYRLKLSNDQIMLLFITALHDDEFFRLCREYITLGEFNEYERDLLFIWQVVTAHYASFHELPTYSVAYAALEQGINNQDLTGSDEDIERAFKTLDVLYNSEVESVSFDVARGYLHSYLVSKLSTNLPDKISSLQPTSAQDISDVLNNNLTRLTNLNTIQATSFGPSFSEGWEKTENLELIPCGVDYIDMFTDGGLLGGEVYGLFGTYGGCKTITAIQVSVGLARYYRQRWEQSSCKAPLGLVYFFNYELTRRVLLVRAMANAAKISQHKLMFGKQLAASVFDSMEDKSRFGDYMRDGIYVASEQERKKAAEQQLNKNWRLVDYSGGGTNPKEGTGYLSEIQIGIKNDIHILRQNGIEAFCGGVVIDYCSAMVRRYLSAKEQRSRDELSEERKLNSEAPFVSGELLAKEFNCPVILIQQLNADANSQDVSKATSHTQATLARTFGENCDFCFCYGVPDIDQRCVVSMTKSRRAAPKPDDIVQIDGEVYSVRSVGHLYEADTKHKTIRERDEQLPYLGNFNAPNVAAALTQNDMKLFKDSLEDL